MDLAPPNPDAFFAAFQPELTGRRPELLPINGGYRHADRQTAVFNFEPNSGLRVHHGAGLTRSPSPTFRSAAWSSSATRTSASPPSNAEYCGRGLDAAFDMVPANGIECGTLDPPLVILASAVWIEASFPAEYPRHQCDEFLRLGLRGTTFVLSTGDDGTADQFGRYRDRATGAGRPRGARCLQRQLSDLVPVRYGRRRHAAASSRQRVTILQG